MILLHFWGWAVSTILFSHTYPPRRNGRISELRRSWVTVRYSTISAMWYTWQWNRFCHSRNIFFRSGTNYTFFSSNGEEDYDMSTSFKNLLYSKSLNSIQNPPTSRIKLSLSQLQDILRIRRDYRYNRDININVISNVSTIK